MKRMLLTMKGHLRPQRSAAMPVCEERLADIPVQGSTKATGELTEEHTAHRSEHEHQSNAPGDVGARLAELRRQGRDGERDGEEVEGVPTPGEEGDEEEHPLLEIEHCYELEWIGRLVHWRLECGQPGCTVFGHAHVLCLGHIIRGVLVARIVHLLVAIAGRHDGDDGDDLG